MAEQIIDNDPQWDSLKEGIDSKRASKDKEAPTEEPTDVTTKERVVEKPKEVKEEVKQDEKVIEKEEPKTVEQEEKSDLIKEVNEKLEGNYNSIDEIKEKLSSLSELDDLKSKVTQLQEENKRIEQLEKELEQKHEDSNPEKVYGGKEGYKNYLIAQKAKGENYPDSVIARIVGNDLNKIDDLSIIMMDIERAAPSMNPNSLYTLALSQIGYDLDQAKEKARAEAEDKGEPFVFDTRNVKLTETQIGQMQYKAAQLREKFNKLKDIEIPEYKGYKETKEQELADVQSQRKGLMDKWGDKQEEIAKDFKIQFKVSDDKGKDDSYEFVDGTFNKQITDLVNKEIVAGNLEPTDRNIKLLKQQIEDVYWSKAENREKVLKKIIEDARTKEETKHDDKVHNTKTINKDSAPPKEITEDKEKIIKFLKDEISLDDIWK